MRVGFRLFFLLLLLVLLLGAIVGLGVGGSLGLALGIIILVAGLFIGIRIANRAWRNKGTLFFLSGGSSASSSEEINKNRGELYKNMITGITYIENFAENPVALFEELKNKTAWDERMVARKTASFGAAYNYSQISYPYKEMPVIISDLAAKLETALHFLPNNCLINYYLDGKSKMGYHSDQTDILAENTGIAIVSLGETRSLRFKNSADPEKTVEYHLRAGSLIYMTQEVQKEWLHAIPKSDTDKGRMSLTFRKMKSLM